MLKNALQMPMPEPVHRRKSELSPLLEGYKPVKGGFDECIDADGELRATYASFLEALPHFNSLELKRRDETTRRIIQEQGITYNVYGDPLGFDRPWQLDLIPFLISAAEWRELEKGLIQRATLINRIIADCYSSQDLIRSGWLPPALVFGQPDFLRPCHGMKPSGDTFVHLYAADLARAPDGKWWVLSDRTQIPTGAGYALGNRLIAARILHESFRHCRVQRLARFFRELQTTLMKAASRRADNPRVVMLTPGPFNETYCEQVWLSRYLGYSLVEGQDLTVRDDRVYLKTLSGLEPVDVILRRVDDDWCDPLELRNDSMLGVAGLVRALRAGNVAVGNTLGSGLLQSPAFMSFLPGLCRHVLGEELKLPSVATWWCGQRSACTYVLEHLEELIVRSSFRPQDGEAEGETVAAQDLPRLRSHIKFQPELFVAQERVALSTAPVWDGTALTPRPVSLRVYLVATAEGYCAMPGGLARVGIEPGGGVVSLQQGGATKDTWVLAEGSIEEVTLLNASSGTIELRRVGNNLPSRLADNFFWLGRYAERSDSTARLLRSLLTRFSPENAGASFSLIQPMLQTLARQGQIAGDAARPGSQQKLEMTEADLLRAISDPKRRGSLRGLSQELQRLSVLVRDRTSNDLWRVLAQLGKILSATDNRPALSISDGVEMLNQVLLHLAALHGLARENMTRAQGWRFLDMGLRLERGVHLCTFLDYALRSREADNPSVLETVLEIADSTLTYRSRYNLMPNIAAVYDLILLDDTNPRSLLFQLNQLVKHFERLPRERESALPSPGQRLLLDCLTRLRLVDPRSLLRRSGNWHHTGVGAIVTRILRDLPRLSEAIAVSYFEHSSISRTGL
jgi:uncharacterized circularly permuted ATP-grasp superfamily protein/uncharacterized alpha-E superfamily protein